VRKRCAAPWAVPRPDPRHASASRAGAARAEAAGGARSDSVPVAVTVHDARAIPSAAFTCGGTSSGASSGAAASSSSSSSLFSASLRAREHFERTGFTNGAFRPHVHAAVDLKAPTRR
jgi:hypothetical protein